MKKLLFLMGCITALTFMNSCTSDSIDDSNPSNIVKKNIVADDDIGNPKPPKP